MLERFFTQTCGRRVTIHIAKDLRAEYKELIDVVRFSYTQDLRERRPLQLGS